MKHINLTNWRGSITDWTKLNYIYGGLDDSYAVKGNLRIDKDNYNYVEFREGYNLFDVANATYSSGDNWNITTDFYLEAGKTYTIWTNETAHNLFTTGVAGWHSVKNVSTTITPSSSGYLMFGASDYNWYSNLASFKQLKIMLNSGSTALPYEPYFEGKKYVITEKLGIVDLGSLNWQTSYGAFYSDNVRPYYNYVQGQIKFSCAKYTEFNYQGSLSAFLQNDKVITFTGQNLVWVRDTAYNDVLVYQLNNPVIEVVE